MIIISHKIKITALKRLMNLILVGILDILFYLNVITIWYIVPPNHVAGITKIKLYTLNDKLVVW